MINLSDYKKIVILTGAGCSTYAGLPTFEEIYADEEVMRSMHIDTLKTDPSKIWKVLGTIRSKVSEIYKNNRQWNSFYQWLYENHLFELPVTIISTNIDGLQTCTQGPQAIQFHGDIRDTICSNPECHFELTDDQNIYDVDKPVCPLCSSALRPTVTLYGEQINLKAERATKMAMCGCDLFIAIGTSGRSGTLNSLMRSAKFENATTILINKDIVKGYGFDYEFIGDAKEMCSNYLTL